MKTIYEGWITKRSWFGGEADVLFLSDNLDELIVQRVLEDIKNFGKFVLVSYYLCNQEMSRDIARELFFVLHFYGRVKGKLEAYYSEFTGFIGCDEKLNIGGHSLPRLLYQNLNKYIIIEIDFKENEDLEYIEEELW